MLFLSYCRLLRCGIDRKPLIRTKATKRECSHSGFCRSISHNCSFITLSRVRKRVMCMSVLHDICVIDVTCVPRRRRRRRRCGLAIRLCRGHQHCCLRGVCSCLATHTARNWLLPGWRRPVVRLGPQDLSQSSSAPLYGHEVQHPIWWRDPAGDGEP
jgi:hypothetical protein